MPMIGFGTYQMSEEEAENSVYEALKAGFRHIDTAEGYNNETGTGLGIQRFLKDNDDVKREDIFVTSKVWPGNAAWGMPEKDYEGTIAQVKLSLEKLKLDYVDLYLIHAPLAGFRVQQYKALVEMKKEGLCKNIGVSNYNMDRFKEIEDAGLPVPDANQIEFHPLYQHKELTKFMDEKGVAKIAYSSLATLSSWRTGEGQGGEVKADTKSDAQKVQKEIADKHGVPESKVLLKWGMQRGYAVLTKSVKPDRIKENIDCFGFELDDEDMEKLNGCDKNQFLAWAQSGTDPITVETPLA